MVQPEAEHDYEHLDYDSTGLGTSFIRFIGTIGQKDTVENTGHNDERGVEVRKEHAIRKVIQREVVGSARRTFTSRIVQITSTAE